jgi:hypothetical protein
MVTHVPHAPVPDAKPGEWRGACIAANREEQAMRAPSIGHNGGPPLDEPIGMSWQRFCWRQAHRQAWKAPPREIALARLRRAEELGMSYREYTAVILDRGVHL